MNENCDMGYQCLLRGSRLSPRSHFMTNFVYLLPEKMRILDWCWRGMKSHPLLCGELHYTRRPIGLDMAVEAIATWDQKLKAESMIRLGPSSPSGQKLRSDWMNQLYVEGGKCIYDGINCD